MNADEDDRLGRTRKRVSRACDRCRLKKDRCDGRRPSCGACVAMAQMCTYEPSTKKRGLPEGYVRGMEKLWALAIDRVDGLEDAICDVVNSDGLPDVWIDDSDALHGKWKESKILGELESLLCVSENEAPSGVKRRQEHSDAGLARESIPLPTGHDFPRFRVTTMTEPTVSDGLEIRAEANASFPPMASQLLDSYFAFQHCWFPILERHKVLRSFYECSKRTKPVAESDQALLWALFALTAQQSRTTEQHHVESSDVGTMQKRARAWVPQEGGLFAIGHVQALLLLTLLDMGNGRWSKAWHLVGFANRIALDLGLGSTSPEPRGAAVMQGCFMLDTLVAQHLSRRPHTRRHDMLSFRTLDEDGAEEWEAWHAPGNHPGDEEGREPSFILSSFNQLRSMFLVLNDVVASDAPSGEARRFYFEERSRQLVRLRPPDLTPGSSAWIPPHLLYLRLFYHAVEIAVLRESFDEGGTPADLLAKLACDVLTLLNQTTQRVPVSQVPPLLEIVLRSACDAAIASQLSFGPHNLPYTIFATHITEHLLHLAETWPCFTALTGLWQSELSAPSASTDPSWSQHPSHGTSYTSIDNITPAYIPQNFNPSSLLPYTNNSTTAQNSSIPNLPMQPSPSLTSSQVDAIFYNLAHLDTTEWTGSRAQGLLDFGFTDEMTFEAFCNDPERTMAPLNYSLLPDARGEWWE